MSDAKTKADAAVEHVLRAIRDDGRKAYLMGYGSQCFNLLTEAYAESTGKDVETFRTEFWAQCSPEKVRVVDEC